MMPCLSNTTPDSSTGLGDDSFITDILGFYSMSSHRGPKTHANFLFLVKVETFFPACRGGVGGTTAPGPREATHQGRALETTVTLGSSISRQFLLR